jgi:hypothetical protein
VPAQQQYILKPCPAAGSRHREIRPSSASGYKTKSPPRNSQSDSHSAGQAGFPPWRGSALIPKSRSPNSVCGLFRGWCHCLIFRSVNMEQHIDRLFWALEQTIVGCLCSAISSGLWAIYDPSRCLLLLIVCLPTPNFLLGTFLQLRTLPCPHLASCHAHTTVDVA